MARIDEAIELLDVEGWLSQYVTTKSGGTHEVRLETCPKCHNDSFKLYVNTESRLWICYVCDWGRHLRDVCLLMAEVSGRHINDVRKELIQTVVPAHTGDLAETLTASFSDNKTAERESAILELEPVPLPGTTNWSSVVANRVLAYAYDRGLTPQEVADYQLTASLRLRNFSGQFLVFPVIFNDVVVNWQGRRAHSNNDPKYVSGDNIADWLWPLGHQCVQTYQSTQCVTLVEGVFDAIGCWRHGIPAVCTFGKKISQRQTALLRQLGVTTVNLAWDADARREIELASVRLRAVFTVRVVDLSEAPPGFTGKVDPGDAIVHQALGAWLLDRLASAMDVRSTEYLMWRIS